MADSKEFPSDKADKFVVRFPEGMRDQIAEAAKANNRSMNAEIVSRLQGSFSLPGKVGDLIEAYQSEGSIYEDQSNLMQKVIQMYEAQKAVSDLQKEIIDRLVQAQQLISIKADIPHPEQVFEDAVNGPPSDDPIVRKEQEERGLIAEEKKSPGTFVFDPKTEPKAAVKKDTRPIYSFDSPTTKK
jgi:hypothetical protein